jgi:hypothetical protein
MDSTLVLDRIQFAWDGMRLEGMTGGEIKQSKAYRSFYRSFGIRDEHGVAVVSHLAGLSAVARPDTI